MGQIIFSAMGRIFAVAALFITAGQSCAVPITFIHTGQGTGTLDGSSFGENVPFTITAMGDTDDRTTGISGEFSIEHLTASILIAGRGVLDIITSTRTFVNNFVPIVGFSRPTDVGGADLFNGPQDAAFSNWHMSTSIGPITGQGVVIQWSLPPLVATNAGILVFNDSSTPATFQAIVRAAPEPSTLWLAALALAALGFARRRTWTRTLRRICSL